MKWNAATNVFAGVNLRFVYKTQKKTQEEKEKDSHDLVWLDKTMLYRLLETKACTLLVLQRADVEGEGTRLLLHFREDRTRRLHLELIRYG